MAKTKTQARSQTAVNGTTSSSETAEQLYASALDLVEQSQPEEALVQAQKLWSCVRTRSATETLPALNLLGEICIELGDEEGAREHFAKAVSLDPEGKIPETMGGGAEKFLWLAQLCEDGGKTSVHWFERGAKALQYEIAELERGDVTAFTEEQLLMMRVEKKRKLANALCGIVEVYMTDLSWEDDAEVRCESLITEAMTVEDETSAEVLQTLASVRLSQERKGDAQSALARSIQTWKELDPEDQAVPDFPTLISLARLLMEAEMENDAMFVLERLIMEDDQSVEAWYLGGWCQYLIAEKHKQAGENDPKMMPDQDQNAVESAMNGSRHWLNMSLKLHKLLDYEDGRLLEHAKELVTSLDAVLGPEEDEAEGGDEHYDDWDGIEEEEDEDEVMKDA
nr:putative assembly chaperone of rpl4 [Quercus suber]